MFKLDEEYKSEVKKNFDLAQKLEKAIKNQPELQKIKQLNQNKFKKQGESS